MLFYTDGTALYDHSHAVVDPGPLGGDTSSCHSAIIVPPAGGGSLYHVFTVGDWDAAGLHIGPVTHDIWTFDRATGAASMHSQIVGFDGASRAYGIEFSPNSRYIYFTGYRLGYINRHEIGVGGPARPFAATDKIDAWTTIDPNSLSAAGALAADPPAPPEKQRLNCRGGQRQLGTHMRTSRRCLTAEQWQREDQANSPLPLSLQVTEGQNDGRQGAAPR